MDTDKTQMMSFVVFGKPIAQPRHRAAARHGHIVHYLPNAHPVHAYKKALIIEAKRHAKGMIEGAVRLEILFSFAFPKAKKGTKEFKISRPDLDNLEKAVMDAMTDGEIWIDDAQVVDKRSIKIYGSVDATSIVIVPIKFGVGEK